VSVAHPVAALPTCAATFVRVLVICLLSAATLPLGMIDRASAAAVDHLVVSEVMTGGTSASDELIELYNPSSASLPLEGLELIYVTASGATVSRRAAWSLGAPEIPPGAHLLVANELGIFAPIADALYASGMAATGGSVALRIQGATTAIDAVGWGTAASTWLEGLPAAAPAAGASLERLPGGPVGSTVDTNSNQADFVVRAVPDPQNAGSPPVPDATPASPTPTAAPTLTPAPTPTATPSASPAPGPMAIAAARAATDGSSVTVEGDALTASDFTEGGGYLADATGAIAVLLDGGSFARGDHLILTGVVDDRFAQRTIRAVGEDVTVTGTGGGPDPIVSSTGSVDESVEARLIRIHGTIGGSPTTLSGGLAFEVNDGSGAIRVVVGTTTGIDTSGWSDGVAVRVIGVVGQRDSSGTGASGYRVQPRAADDVEMLPGATPTPSPGGSSGPHPTPTPSASDGSVFAIADARAAAKNARVTVRGVVTLASGTVDAGSAVIQDGSGAILLRLGDEAGPVSRGQLLEVAGVRSTKSGMESLRVSVAPRRLGTAPDPTARALRTGDAAEAVEAQLVVVRGAVVASARRASSGTVSFEVDDGSGPLRVVLGASLAADGAPFSAGTWVEALGVLGQETTGAQPMRGYRVWPRAPGDVRVLAAATGRSSSGGDAGSGGGTPGGSSAATASLAAVGEAGLADLRVGATLVSSAWPELGVAGLLWDGARLVGIAPASAARVEQVAAGHAMPVSLELGGLRELDREARAGVALVALGEGQGDTVVGSAPPAPPSPAMPGPGDPPSWVSLVGRVRNDDRRQVIELAGARVVIQQLCRRGGRLPEGTVSLVGVATADPSRIIVACDGVRPAPALALVASVQASALPLSSQAAPRDSAAAATAGRRLVAAGLLAIGVAILGLALVVRRRFDSDEPDAATQEDPSAAETAPRERRLALVRLPNEHGP
jgi:hypothetical protein